MLRLLTKEADNKDINCKRTFTDKYAENILTLLDISPNFLSTSIEMKSYY